jgi:hypothetical protein
MATIAAFMPEPHILLSVVQGASQRQPGAERGLPRRRLALAGGQHAAHHHLVDPVGVDAAIGERGADRRRAEFGRRRRGKLALKAAHRRARRADDDDGFHGPGSPSCVIEGVHELERCRTAYRDSRANRRSARVELSFQDTGDGVAVVFGRTRPRIDAAVAIQFKDRFRGDRRTV